MTQAVLPVLLLPDAGPLITLANANALDLLLKPGWQVQVVDMVEHEVTRTLTATSKAIANWISSNQISIVPTKTFLHYQALRQAAAETGGTVRKSNLGEMAIQEAMNEFALLDPALLGVFLFEDHKIARSSFLLPSNCRKVSTRAFLVYLEQKGWLASSFEVERAAIQNGRAFAQIRFPPETS